MKTKLLLLLLLANFSIFAQINLVPNGNFENWSSSSQPDNWFRYLNGLVFQSSTAQNGSSSTNITISSGTFNFINSEYFAVQANKTYRITLYHKVVSGTFSALDLSIYHKPGTIKEEVIKKSDVAFSTIEWRKVEFDYTPIISENIEVDIWATGILNSEILVDNVSVVDVAEIGLQYTLIPDAKFEAKLIALGHDDVADGKVLTSKINKLTDLSVSNSSITDLTGIQDFVTLKNLVCNGNQLTSLNVSKNIALTNLDCENNLLAALNLTSNTALQKLNCGNNGSSGNKISTLDLSKNINLKNLTIQQLSSLSSIDLSKNVALESLHSWYTNLLSLDLSKNTALEILSCPNNKLSSLNLETNILLKNLDCSFNALTTLDVSNNKNLVTINCNSNNLSNLNLKNGNNSNLKSGPFITLLLKIM